MKKYFANFMTSNGTHFEKAIEGTNKQQLTKDVKETAKGNTPLGSSARWRVYDSNERIVAAGTIDEKGHNRNDYDLIGCYYD